MTTSAATTSAGTRVQGIVTQVMGNVVDIAFPGDHMPSLYSAIETEIPGQPKPLTLEVEQLLGNSAVRCVGMGPTDGMMRGQIAWDIGRTIEVPVGPKTLGRLFNVLGEAIDGLPPVGTASMQRDVLAGRPSELEAQVGAVVRLGERLGVEVPVHRTTYAALVPQERRASGKVAWG